ncbi:hypothetical protein [Methanocella sp. MCL-LM]|uniref:hypothetical protein n=1 Tax=Methanocella sp. MCL-LM TaxID=3412035 RepID=UPI003C712A60
MPVRDESLQEHDHAIDRSPDGKCSRAYTIGYWSSLAATVCGIVYLLILAGALIFGQFTYPPSETVQTLAGVITLIVCPIIVVMMASLHTVTAAEKKALSLSSLAFTVLFAMAVSINRFTQLGVLRQRAGLGIAEGIEWFLPYGSHSIMLGLEIMGWGWFLGLALLIAASIFSGGALQAWLRWSMVLYGVLGLISAIAFLMASPLSAIGFIAWGPILFIITGLLAIHFRQAGDRLL